MENYTDTDERVERAHGMADAMLAVLSTCQEEDEAAGRNLDDNLVIGSVCFLVVDLLRRFKVPDFREPVEKMAEEILNLAIANGYPVKDSEDLKLPQADRFKN